MKIKKVKLKIIISIILLTILIGITLISIYTSKNMLEVVTYEIESEKIKNQIKIIQLTDLHESAFEENNQNLIKTVKS